MKTRTTPNVAKGVALACLTVFLAGTCHAQTYPSKPIAFIVPAAAGGPTDIAGRLAAQLLSEELKQPVVIDNKTGAGLTVGTTYIAKSKPDGYTIGIGGASSHGIPPGLYPNLTYNAEKDFEPISLLFTTPIVLVASPTLGIKTLRDLVAHAKANPGKVNYASGGNGTLSHLSGESLKLAAKIDLVHVPYKGSAPANTDLMGGQVQVMFQALPLAMPFISSGKLVAIGLAGPQRSSMMPQLPTLAESGLPGFEVREWFALFAPAGTPRDVVMRLNAAMLNGLKTPQGLQRFAAAGLVPTGSTPEEAAKVVSEERRAWAKIISEAGTKID